MSPEQVFGDADLDARADVWALGIIVFECIMGKRPFEGDSFGQIIKQITMGDAPKLSDAASPAMRLLTESLLARSKEERPRDAMAVQELLARERDHFDTVEAAAKPSAKRTPAASLGYRKWYVALALLPALALGLFAIRRTAPVSVAPAIHIDTECSSQRRDRCVRVNMQHQFAEWRKTPLTPKNKHHARRHDAPESRVHGETGTAHPSPPPETGGRTGSGRVSAYVVTDAPATTTPMPVQNHQRLVMGVFSGTSFPSSFTERPGLASMSTS
jgi:serine/threonine protein kinase